MKLRRRTVQDWCLYVGFAGQLALGVYLLTSEQYFAVTYDDTEVTFGLWGVNRDGDFISYSDYKANCDSSDFICPYVTDLSAGGAMLVALLVASLLLEVASIISTSVLRCLLSRAISSVEAGASLSPVLRLAVKAVKSVQVATLLDPAVLLAGVVAWTVKSRFADIGDKTELQADIGVVMLVVKCALALSLSTGLFLCLLDNWRTNAAVLIPTDAIEKNRVVHTSPSYIFSEKSLPGVMEDSKS